MGEWKPQKIESAPDVGNFLAPNGHGDWMVVRRYNNPFGRQNTVINERTGRWWSPDCWLPIPPPPSEAGR